MGLLKSILLTFSLNSMVMKTSYQSFLQELVVRLPILFFPIQKASETKHFFVCSVVPILPESGLFNVDNVRVVKILVCVLVKFCKIVNT